MSTLWRIASFKPKSLFSLKFNRVSGTWRYKDPTVCARLISTEVNENVQAKYRKEDNVSSEYKIIYRAPLTGYLKFANILSSIALVSVPACTLWTIYSQGGLNFPVIMDGMEVIRNKNDFMIYYVGFFLVNIQIMMVMYKYPFRIYSNHQGQYIAVFRSYFSWRNFRKSYCQGEFFKVNSIMPWGEALFRMKGRRVFILEDYFHRPADLNNMITEEEAKDSKKAKEESKEG